MICLFAPLRKYLELFRPRFSRRQRKYSLFTSVCLLPGRRCPLLPRLYRQKAACGREGVPFQSKVDLAVAESENLTAAEHAHPCPGRQLVSLPAGAASRGPPGLGPQRRAEE